MYRRLIGQEMSRVYGLSYDPKRTELLIKIHQQFIDNNALDLRGSRIASGIIEEFKFENLMQNFGGDIGFDGVIQRVGNEGEFAVFGIEMPKIKWLSDIPCDECHGDGKDHSICEREHCMSCHGLKRKFFYEFGEARKISASLTVIFSALNYYLFHERPTACQLPQLLSIRTITKEGNHGGSLDGEYGISFCRGLERLKNQKEIIVERAIEAMKSAHRQMFQDPTCPDYGFRVIFDGSPYLIIDCPGDRTGIFPGDEPYRIGKGCDFSCHNVDHPDQQLMIIIGLATFHDAVDQLITSHN